MSEDDSEPLDALVDIARGVRKLYDEHEDDINDLVGVVKDTTVAVDDDGFPTQVTKADDQVEITVDVGSDEDVNDFTLDYEPEGNILKIETHLGSIAFKLPDDILMGKKEASINNNVININIPRA